MAAAALREGRQKARPSEPSAAERGQALAPKPPRADLWRPAPKDSPLAGFADAAFAGADLLATDGSRAALAAAGLAPRPIEVSVPIRRVFSAAGRLFAQGESEGAPFLIALVGKDAQVVPMPCALSALAGDGDVLLGACAQGANLAESDDGGRTFRKLALALPAAPVSAGAEVEASVEAVAVDADGSSAAVVTRRWESEGEGERLRWSFAQGATRGRAERSFHFAPLAGLARALAARLSGGVLTVAGISLGGEGWPDEPASPRLRLFRGPAGQAPQPAGEPGPACALHEEAEGVLLDGQVGVFRCGRAVVLSAGGGARWLSQEGLGAAAAVRGGDMRLALRTDRGVFELRLPLRATSGAVAERAPPQSSSPGQAAAPVVPAGLIAEPAPDGGAAGR